MAFYPRGMRRARWDFGFPSSSASPRRPPPPPSCFPSSSRGTTPRLGITDISSWLEKPAGQRRLRHGEGRASFRGWKALPHLRREHGLRREFPHPRRRGKDRRAHGEVWHQLRALSPHGHAGRAERHLGEGQRDARSGAARPARLLHRASSRSAASTRT